MFGWKGSSSKKKTKAEKLLKPRQIAGLFDTRLTPNRNSEPGSLDQTEFQDREFIASMQENLRNGDS